MKQALIGVALTVIWGIALAKTEVAIYLASTSETPGQHVGKIVVTESPHGLVFTPHIEKFAPGLHGFHVHENASCKPATKNGKMVPAQAAGDHFDPFEKNKHGLPWGDGHLGDLPALFVNDKGQSQHPVLAPRLGLDDVRGRSLVIHAGGDNYSDEPEVAGGGGKRIACGVIPESQP